MLCELIDVLLLPPRARRALARTRDAHTRRRRTRMPRGPHAGVHALPCAHSMCVQYVYVAYRHDTPHGMRARGAYETSVFEHYGATSTTDVTCRLGIT